MKLRIIVVSVACLLCHATAAFGQLVGLADDIIVISKGMSNRGAAGKTTALGPMPGDGAFRDHPGGQGNLLDETRGPPRFRPQPGHDHRSVLTAMARAPARATRAAPRVAPPQSPATIIGPTISPQYGLLELPSGELEGPPQGMTLDQAIERLLRDNPDLRAKRYELPQARADVLTASQRANPLYFLSANNLPYRPYSPGRFGAVQYAPTVVQPFDVNDKRRARIEAASQAVRVLEAQYQNAVRLAIDELYVAYTDVIVARETLRYAEVNLASAHTLFEASRSDVQRQAISASDRMHLAIQDETAHLEVDQARNQLLSAKHRLAAILAIPREAAGQIEVRGRIRPPSIRLPGREELVGMALTGRPDIQAYRLGVGRAQADVHVARKEAIDDVFVVYSPFVVQNNVPIGKQNVTSFSLGVMGSIPIFDRNQGEIRRAEVNVSQTRAALTSIERDAVAEVERALLEFEGSSKAVERMERIILPASERARVAAFRDHEAGRTGTVEYLFALRERNEVVRLYRDALVRRRRSMLRLNTVVGRRLLP